MKMAIIFVAIVLAGCGHRGINCPDGEPVAVWSVEDAYQTYAREYEAKFSVAANQIDKIASDENVSIESKLKVVKLRQDLDQERSALQERLKTAVISLQTTPCDKEVRRRVLDLQQEFADRAKEIPERLKGPGNVHNQQMSNSPGSLQVGSVSSMTLNQFSNSVDAGRAYVVDPMVDLAIGQPFGSSTIITVNNSRVQPIVDVSVNTRCIFIGKNNQPWLFFDVFDVQAGGLLIPFRQPVSKSCGIHPV